MKSESRPTASVPTSREPRAGGVTWTVRLDGPSRPVPDATNTYYPPDYTYAGHGLTPDAALADLRANVESARDVKVQDAQTAVEHAALVLALETLRAS